ncbi:hypothetical protein H257_05958 [Aphanomyces astaci]|uniref:Myb-like domain-containing protein n=1 Tax=Aphanomyces astaci TaxID=112090 RepID=W4GQZ2_APHAT|nr:hypothetical protein H257_05958 [Aphanomyces astaci]ETV81434.1 hypothetical protein H257_05958 [Aphanomyces astaci]|eukprot:XP_009829292.1 hypothetical protein H257_05958 [Aphanomyces astaci]
MNDEVATDITEGQQARKWWSDADDMSLLTQVNIDLPFKQAKNTTKAWDAVANKLRQVHGFGRIGLDGKKASSRFYQLLRVHRKFQESSKYLSGVEQDETGKIMLLDELIQLFDEASDERQAERATTAAKATEKEAAAGYMREQAMMRGRRKSNEGDDSTDSDVASRKRKAIFETQEREIALEHERLEFKKYKFEMELQEREKDRMERIQQREDERNRNDDMMDLIRHLLHR